MREGQAMTPPQGLIPKPEFKPELSGEVLIERKFNASITTTPRLDYPGRNKAFSLGGKGERPACPAAGPSERHFSPAAPRVSNQALQDWRQRQMGTRAD